MSREFAYGRDYTRGVSCPATRKTFDSTITNPVSDVADEYDFLLRNEERKPTGAVSEEKAKEMWEKAIEQVEERGDIFDDAVEQARQVQKDLGWND